MGIKITERKKEVEKPVLYFKDVPDGCVYKTSEDIAILKVNISTGVVLQGPNGSDYMDVAGRYKRIPVSKILGKLVEVVVE